VHHSSSSSHGVTFGGGGRGGGEEVHFATALTVLKAKENKPKCGYYNQ